MSKNFSEVINEIHKNINIDFLNLKQIVTNSLNEDIQTGDLTATAIVDTQKSATANIIARESGVIAGIAPAMLAFFELDDKLELIHYKTDGDLVEIGTEVLKIKGKAASLLTAERTALNFLGHLSGVATHAKSFVDAVAGLPVKLLDTRKTTPEFRLLEKLAVLAGGMKNHRFGLYDQILVKENHLRASGLSITEAVKKCKEKYDFAIIGVEAETIKEFIEAMNSNVNYILLDDFTLEDMSMAVKMRNEFVEKTSNKIELEASGGINLQTVRKVAETGIDRISVGAVTHSSKRLDLTCLFDFNIE